MIGDQVIIREDRTSDTTSVLAKQGHVRQIRDYVHIQERRVFRPYYGKKGLKRRLGELSERMSSFLAKLVNEEIIEDFKSVKAYVDPVDPEVVVVEAAYKPVLAWNYVFIKNRIRATL